VFTDGSEQEAGNNLGHFAKIIKSNFYNFMRIDQSYIINIEMIKTIEDKTLFFDSGKFIILTNVAKARLKREHLMV